MGLGKGLGAGGGLWPGVRYKYIYVMFYGFVRCVLYVLYIFTQVKAAKTEDRR